MSSKLFIEMANLVITIDGPAGSGKSTVGRLLAERLGASFLDTGAMYRAVTLAAIEANVNMSDEEKLLGVLDNRKFQFVFREGRMLVFIDGRDITREIRDPKVTANARHIASAVKMRAKLVEMQRQFAQREEKIVTEGRDQGTVAFPDADVKFFLTADVKERARRRRDESLRDENLEQIQRAIEERDKSDRDRTEGPLRPAEDAIVIDTTDLSIDEVVEKLLHCVEKNV